MNRLKELRELNNETQDELGKILNLTKSTISKYEKGDLDISNETLLKIAQHFNVTTDYLLGRTDNPNEKKYKHLDNTLIGRVSSKMEKMSDDELELLDKLIDRLMKDDK